MPLEHEASYLPFVKSPLAKDQNYADTLNVEHVHEHSSNGNDLESGLESSPDRQKHAYAAEANSESTLFRRFTQSTNLELFYDLFFVANLAAFTYLHEVNDTDTLKQYVGFFCIIWFTWYQVSLYDVRFAMDSVFERVCKACQLSVMVGFAICGPNFNPGEKANAEGGGEGPSLKFFKALTLVLFISRIVLVAGYLQTTWLARAYKDKVIVPLLLIAATYFIAAMIYLGLYWSFYLDSNGESNSYIAWYVVAVAETILTTAVSIVWRNLSFVETHIVERMSLLTLIILGEGAIAIARACYNITIANVLFPFTGSVPAVIICAVLNLYFMYMIYFDFMHEELFGSIRQQIWTILHFPLHTALVLAVEGASQCIMWNAGIHKSNAIVDQFQGWQAQLFPPSGSPVSNSSWTAAADDLRATATDVMLLQLAMSSTFASTAEGFNFTYQIDNSVIPTISNGAEDSDAAAKALWWLLGTLYFAVLEIAGFSPPESDSESDLSIQTLGNLTPIPFASADETESSFEDEALGQIYSSWRVFRLTYVYFLICTGVFIILCSILATINRGRKTQPFWYRFAITAVVGLGIALLAAIAGTDSLQSYVSSPWLLPTVTLSLFFIVVLTTVRLPAAKKVFRKR